MTGNSKEVRKKGKKNLGVTSDASVKLHDMVTLDQKYEACPALEI